MDQQVNGYCWELCWLVYDSLVCFLAAMVFLHLTLAMGAVAWPLTGKQPRNFRGEELSNKRPGAIIFKRDKKSSPASVFFFFSQLPVQNSWLQCEKNESVVECGPALL